MGLNNNQIDRLVDTWTSKRYLLDAIGSSYASWLGRRWSWQQIANCSLCERGCSCCVVKMIFRKICSYLSDYNYYMASKDFHVSANYKRVFAVTNILDKLTTLYVEISALDSWGRMVGYEWIR